MNLPHALQTLDSLLDEKEQYFLLPSDLSDPGSFSSSDSLSAYLVTHELFYFELSEMRQWARTEPPTLARREVREWLECERRSRTGLWTLLGGVAAAWGTLAYTPLLLAAFPLLAVGGATRFRYFNKSQNLSRNPTVRDYLEQVGEYESRRYLLTHDSLWENITTEYKMAVVALTREIQPEGSTVGIQKLVQEASRLARFEQEREEIANIISLSKPNPIPCRSSILNSYIARSMIALTAKRLTLTDYLLRQLVPKPGAHSASLVSSRVLAGAQREDIGFLGNRIKPEA